MPVRTAEVHDASSICMNIAGCNTVKSILDPDHDAAFAERRYDQPGESARRSHQP